MVVMWMSSGGTKSVLHNDDQVQHSWVTIDNGAGGTQENLLTLVDGRKEVFLWEPTQAKNLYVHEAIRGGISPVDQVTCTHYLVRHLVRVSVQAALTLTLTLMVQAAVDMETFPKFGQAKYMRAMLEPGDALYCAALTIQLLSAVLATDIFHASIGIKSTHKKAGTLPSTSGALVNIAHWVLSGAVKVVHGRQEQALLSAGRARRPFPGVRR